MKVYLIVLTSTLSLVRCGNTRVKTPVYSAAEGEDLNVRCLSGVRSSTIFCKNDCNSPKNILFDSKNATLDSRYSFVPGAFDMMYVRIKNVSSSDSGAYVCQGTCRKGSELWEFVLSVTTGYDVTPACSTQSGPRHHCWLMFSVAMVITSVLVLWIYGKKNAQNDQEHTQNSRCPRAETAEYENMRALSESADCTYHNLCVETIDPNQTYCSI